MELKHPNDPAVARRLEAFEKELRSGYHFPGSAENVFEQLKRLDDEAETRWQAILKKEAAEAENARIAELAKRRAEKAARFYPRYTNNWLYAPGAIVGCSICGHITSTPPSQPPMTNGERLREAWQLLSDVLPCGYLPRGVVPHVIAAMDSIAIARENILGEGNV
jgi:hypothetical protein